MKLFKNKTKALCAIALLLVFGMGLTFATTFKTNTAHAASDPSIFTFVQTSATECSVKLYKKDVKKVKVPDTATIYGVEYTVTSVAASGFLAATNLELVSLPNTIKSIGTAAFMNCTNLTVMILRDGLESIGANAFASTNLNHLVIPESVKNIGTTILRGCATDVYARVKLPEGAEVPFSGWVKSWNNNNFREDVEFDSDFTPGIRYVNVDTSIMAASSLMSLNIDIDDEVVIVDQFQELVTQQGVDVYIPAEYEGKKVVGIAQQAFVANVVDTITIGYSDEPIYIGTWAFAFQQGSSITINRDVIFEDTADRELGNFEFWNSDVSTGVFYGAEVETIILPDTVEEFTDDMFHSCENLTDIHFIAPEQLSKSVCYP